MLDPSQAKQEAIAEAAELLQDPFWRPAFENATPSEPVLVTNESKPDRSYYLVDFRKGDRSTGRMVINANTGQVSQVTGCESDGASLPPFITPDKVDDQLLAQAQQPAPPGLQSEIPAGVPKKELIWKPSIDSRSMFQPFYKLTWENDVERFLRTDGALFEKLTPPEDETPE
jgi:hypothetical protein